MSNANDQIPPLFFRPRYAMNTLENFTNTQLVKHYSGQVYRQTRPGNK